MKKSILVTGLFILTAQLLWSQYRGDVSLGYGIGNFGAFRVSYNHLLPNKVSFNVFYNWQFRKSQNAPANYTKPHSLFFNSGSSNKRPLDNISTFGVMGGYAIEKSKVRFNLRGGFAYNSFTIPENFVWVPPSEWWGIETGGYHTYDSKQYHSLGFVAEPRIEFSLSPKLGLGISCFTNLNSYKSIYGIGFDLMIGRMR